jgi:hypothetical protein
MDMHTRFTQAVTSEQPLLRLRAEVQSLLAEGYEREVLLSQLESFRDYLRDSDDESSEDIVLDVMDFLTGWCHPDMIL